MRAARAFGQPQAGSRSAYSPDGAVPYPHGDVQTIPITLRLIQRINRALREWRRFRMPTQKEEQRLDALTHEHVMRAAMVSNGAYLGKAQTAREWT